jgi:HlyD family secretion protein
MASRVFRRLLAVGLALVAVAILYFSFPRPAALPPGIASGNGRLEATEVDVATKLAGRLASIKVQEGDNATLGQVLAELDAEDLKAQLRAAEAQAQQARAAIQGSHAAVASAKSQQDLARSTLARTRQLAGKGFLTGDRLDKDQSALQAADAGMAAARSRVSEGHAALAAAEARSDALRVTLNDTSLRAPVAGRVLYRLAQTGEILPAGGKALTLLDMADVHMSIYLPTDEAGRLRVGSPARIVLDALPDQPIPAQVVFVAPRSQFTPKEVETRNEREKLMFRVKLRVASEWLAAHGDLAKPGMPGMAYVQTGPEAAWPAALMPR